MSIRALSGPLGVAVPEQILEQNRRVSFTVQHLNQAYRVVRPDRVEHGPGCAQGGVPMATFYVEIVESDVKK